MAWLSVAVDAISASECFFTAARFERRSLPGCVVLRRCVEKEFYSRGPEAAAYTCTPRGFSLLSWGPAARTTAVATIVVASSRTLNPSLSPSTRFERPAWLAICGWLAFRPLLSHAFVFKPRLDSSVIFIALNNRSPSPKIELLQFCPLLEYILDPFFFFPRGDRCTVHARSCRVGWIWMSHGKSRGKTEIIARLCMIDPHLSSSWLSARRRRGGRGQTGERKKEREATWPRKHE